VRNDITDDKGKLVVSAGTEITKKMAEKLGQLTLKNVEVVPFVSSDIDFLSADDEEDSIIAQANAILDEDQRFLEEKVEARSGDQYFMEFPGENRLYGCIAETDC
jgi:DNA-directed RNA polymerase subunit beta